MCSQRPKILSGECSRCNRTVTCGPRESCKRISSIVSCFKFTLTQGILLGLCTAVKCVQVCVHDADASTSPNSSSPDKDGQKQRPSVLRRAISLPSAPCAGVALLVLSITRCVRVTPSVDALDWHAHKHNRLKLGAETRTHLPESVSHVMLPQLYDPNYATRLFVHAITSPLHILYPS